MKNLIAIAIFIICLASSFIVLGAFLLYASPMILEMPVPAPPEIYRTHLLSMAAIAFLASVPLAARQARKYLHYRSMRARERLVI